MKRIGKKRIEGEIWSGGGWSVRKGRVVRGARGKVAQTKLFKIIGEKIPLLALVDVERFVEKECGRKPKGIYLVHDSMGCPRYIGRGKIFDRLHAHNREFSRELVYSSFYVVEDKVHEREIETLLLRAASYLTALNKRKIRASIENSEICRIMRWEQCLLNVSGGAERKLSKVPTVMRRPNDDGGVPCSPYSRRRTQSWNNPKIPGRFCAFCGAMMRRWLGDWLQTPRGRPLSPSDFHYCQEKGGAVRCLAIPEPV